MIKDKNQYEDEIEGILENIVFRNDENGYSVVRIKPSDSIRKIVATGNLIGVNIGEKLLLKGNWIIHPEYGQQFQVVSYQVEQPVTSEGIVKFLSSSLIKGIGPRTAEKIVKVFRERTLEVIEKEPDKLETVEGIGRAKREMIEKGWREQKEIKNIMIFLQQYNINTTLALKIYKTYGDESFQVLRSNPYRLTEDIYGIGFKTADKIAQNLGITQNSEHRIQAALKYLVLQFSEDGHCFARREELLLRSEELLAVSRNEIEKELKLMLARGILLADEDAIYYPAYFYSERKAADRLKALISLKSSQLSQFRTLDWEKVFNWLYEKRQIKYTALQEQAIRECLTNKVTLLTGGPGTGKSTITAALTSIMEAKKLKLILGAPTGRAARRLTELTGHPAQTIHRLLEFSWQDGLQFRRNEGNPLEAALIIIDEASMLDTMMLHHLLKAVQNDTHLVLIGDVDQLPSMGAGYVLNDIINSGSVPVVRLDQIFRQKSDSMIITNAHRIRQGIRPLFSQDKGDFFFFGTDNPSKTTETVLQLVTEKIPQKFGFDPINQIQVLAPMYKGEMGINELNRQLQEALNPCIDKDKDLTFGEKIYRIKDRVIQLKNNYEKDVFNGDLGIITDIDKESQTVKITFDNRIVDYEFYELDQITHSYAISIHKSQGSEFPVVVIPLLMQHYIMLQRNLLYTGISRARQLVVLVGSIQAIDVALRNNTIIKRNTKLADLLRLPVK